MSEREVRARRGICHQTDLCSLANNRHLVVARGTVVRNSNFLQTFRDGCLLRTRVLRLGTVRSQLHVKLQGRHEAETDSSHSLHSQRVRQVRVSHHARERDQKLRETREGRLEIFRDAEREKHHDEKRESGEKYVHRML